LKIPKKKRATNWNDEPSKRSDVIGIRLNLKDIIEQITHVTYLNTECSQGGKNGGDDSSPRTENASKFSVRISDLTNMMVV
jgi:hypothetical protein